MTRVSSESKRSCTHVLPAHKAFIDTMGRVADGTGLTPKERWAGTFRAFQHLTGFYVAKTLQGAAATMLGAAVGRSLGIKKAEAEDDKFDFAGSHVTAALVRRVAPGTAVSPCPDPGIETRVHVRLPAVSEGCMP